MIPSFFRLLLLALAMVQAADAAAQRNRLMPPAAVSCDRNQLTSFEGRLEGLEIGADHHRATLRTDWDSLETFDLPLAADGPAYLLFGEPMAPGQWRALLPDPAQPPAGLRVIAWVCDCPQQVTLDWRPAESAVLPDRDP